MELLVGLEPTIWLYESLSLPLAYRSIVQVIGIEPMLKLYESLFLPLDTCIYLERNHISHSVYAIIFLCAFASDPYIRWCYHLSAVSRRLHKLRIGTNVTYATPSI